MEKILNFNEPLDVNLLDDVVQAVYTGNDETRNHAQRILTELKQSPQAWNRVDTILEHSKSQYTKFLALQILDDLIKYRWKILPPDQQQGIKNYVISLVLKLSKSEELLVENRMVLQKLDLNLVQILKHDWPSHWKSFIPEITTASQTNEFICENNMRILKTLSEEVFDFSKGEMTQAKISQLKSSLNNEFYIIFQLCEFVMGNSQKERLILITLETLLRYLSWIPMGYVFETTLVKVLIERFFPIPKFRNITLACLTEIAQLQVEDNSYSDHFAQIFAMTMERLYNILPTTVDIPNAFKSGSDEDRAFLQGLALFFGTFLKYHRQDVEKDQYTQIVLDAHHYLVQISLVHEIEVFRICLDYWSELAAALYNEAPVTGQGPLMLDVPTKTPRRQLYSPILSKVRNVIISRMAKPEEVIVVEDEHGNIIREVRTDGEQITRYKTMRSVLVYLTHLDYNDTRSIMLSKLDGQVHGSQFAWQSLNTLCWAIGSIADTQPEIREKRFLVQVIKDLLNLCDMKRGKDNKAVVASNIMYIVGQYPRFLCAHWKFLSTVINKLFEFMHETHPGVQDMSCDTFLKIVKKCQPKFSDIQEGETEPFTHYVIKNIPTIISDLNESQIQTFYEAVGHMISLHKPQDMEQIVTKFMELPHQTWVEIMNQAKRDTSVLNNTEVVKKLANILKTHVRACCSVGPGFISQIALIYLDLLNVCKFYSSEISKAVIQIGPVATKHSTVKDMRTVKRESIKLITTFIGVSADIKPIVQSFLPPLLPSVLEDYRLSVPDARDHEVLALMVKIVARCGVQVTDEIPKMFGAVFEPTLQMITVNFHDYPEIRTEFYNFLMEVNVHCFAAFKRMPPEHFKLVVHSIIWAFKHTMRDISEIGLMITYGLLNQINNDNTDVANNFYKNYFLALLQDLFCILTDTLHKSGFKWQGKILLQMFMMVETGRVTVPLWDPQTVNNPNMSNRIFIREHVMGLLEKSFSNLTQAQVHTFVTGLFDQRQDLNSFCTHLRDFLVQLKEFSSGDDNSQLYITEREAELKQRTQQELNIPGLVGPYDSRRDVQ